MTSAASYCSTIHAWSKDYVYRPNLDIDKYQGRIMKLSSCLRKQHFHLSHRQGLCVLVTTVRESCESNAKAISHVLMSWRGTVAGGEIPS